MDLTKNKLFSERTHCIICNEELQHTFFDSELTIPIASYSKDISSNNDIFIPYNVYKCSRCKTSQTKYLGDLDIIYKFNHADSTGSIMNNLHKEVKKTIASHISEISNIIEIGSAKGILSHSILESFPDISKYYIVEPSYIGAKHDKQIIINDFFENIDFSIYTDANTLIMSHVFEHFYNPIDILNIIKNNNNIKNIMLVWPDLEYYKDNNIYHCVNTEHTFYVDNKLIEILFNNISFKMVENIKYSNHSVIYYFTRCDFLEKQPLINENHSLEKYFNDLLSKKDEIIEFIEKNKNNNRKICIWPSSIHSQFLMMVLKDIQIDYILDNSPNKIGKYIYGYNLECKSFEETIIDSNNAIILNGGCFNKEILDNVKKYNSNIFIIANS